MTFALIVVGGYLLGSCPWGYWLVRIFRNADVRQVGSGNIGGTNVWRTYGRSLGIPVIALDALKGFVPALVGVTQVSHLCGIIAGGAAMLGHSRPIFLRFARGGKMVATGAGVFCAVAIWAVLAAAIVWVVLFLATRYVSIASLGAAVVIPVAAALIGYPTSVIVLGVVAGSAVVLLHRGNISRLRSGTEHRMQFGRA